MACKLLTIQHSLPLSLSLSLSLSARKMHGRPRKAPTREEEKVLALKAAKLRPLQSHFLHFHHNKIYTEEALDVNAKFPEANPEYLTAWNYRKFAVEHILSHFETDTEIDPDSIKSIYSEELRVRSYGAWYHRKWVLSKGHSSVDQELQLLGVFLKKDSRNFHAWNYQRFIAALKNRLDEEELHFTTDLINNNFSNYSSWHNRRLTSSLESLLRHCCHYRDSASSGTNNYICLRLSNLSLSHIGSIEKLLWVQMLDLSHNQLSSIEGLQAMQLLSCLNLINNKMGCFSALGPLKLLKSLKVLDISYNEIGAHAVDTRSDIIGNVVAEEEFKLFLVKILPALNCLDGVELH
ncbi:unnamed protein product [Camellia sinensis]